jgi:hypothetical protein
MRLGRRKANKGIVYAVGYNQRVVCIALRTNHEKENINFWGFLIDSCKLD